MNLTEIIFEKRLGVSSPGQRSAKCRLRLLTSLCLSALALSSAYSDEIADTYGVLNVMDYGAIPDDGLDDTEAIQNAIDASLDGDGIDDDKTIYFPAGVYDVSDTLQGVVLGTGSCGGAIANACRLVGFSSEDQEAEKAIIRLADNAPGFDDVNNVKPIVWLWFDAPNTSGDQESCHFKSTVRNLVIECGTGNAGAAGLKFASAQDSSIENVHVDATGAYAGFLGVPGRSQVNMNLSVEGGLYGIDLRTGSTGASLYGITLRNQSKAGIFNRTFRGMTIVGMDFMTDQGTARAIDTGGSNADQGHIVLLDSKIEYTTSTSQSAVFSAGRCSVSLLNVYSKGITKVVGGAMDADQVLNTSDSNLWTHVVDYALTPAEAGNARGTPYYGKNIIDGVQFPDEALAGTDAPPIISDWTVSEEVSPPINLVERHLWDSRAMFLDSDAIVLSPSGGDDTSAIQQALADASDPGVAFSKVLLLAGEYTISSTLEVPGNVTFMGMPGYVSSIVASTEFANSFNDPDDSDEIYPRGWMLETPDDPDAKPVIKDLLVQTPSTASSGLGVMHWRSGKGEVLGLKPSRSVYQESHRQIVRVDGNGGGKWYGYADHYAVFRNNPITNDAFTKFSIGDTVGNPLTFYGLNLERGGRQTTLPQQPFCDINNASNIRILGAKTETDGLILRIRGGSSNVFVSSMFPLVRTNVNSAFIQIDPGTLTSAESQIDLRSFFFATSSNLIVEDFFAPAEPNSSTLRESTFVGVYKRGTFDPSPWDLAANEAPTVMLIDPVDGMVVTPGTQVNLLAEASDSDGTVLEVEFDVNGEAVGYDSESPYTGTFTPEVEGVYSVTAIATDDLLENTESSPRLLIAEYPTDYYAPFTSTAPVVDGVVDAVWETSPLGLIDNSLFSFGDDLEGAAFSLLWDEEGLYMIVYLTSETRGRSWAHLSNRNRLRRLANSVLLLVDSNFDRSGEFNEDDYRFNFGSQGRGRGHFRFRQNSECSIKPETAWGANETGFVCEVYLPWEAIGKDSPSVGALIGLDLVVTERKGSWRNTKVASWHLSSMEDIGKPSTWGTVRFAP